MWKRTTIAAALLFGSIGCEEPVEEAAPVAETGERYEDFEAADDEYGADTNDMIDTASSDEARPAIGRTDCVDPTDPMCTTEPRPSVMQEIEDETEPGAARAPEPRSDGDAFEPEPEVSATRG